MGKIIMTTDFSVPSEELLPYLQDLSKAGMDEVLLVNVVEDKNAEDEVAVDDMEYLQGFADTLCQHGINASITLRWGQAAEEINIVAQEESADFIVAYSKGRQILKRTFLGSTSIDLARISVCPVLIEKGKVSASADDKSAHFKKIVLPTDFSFASLESLAFIKKMRNYIGEVVFVHVIEEKNDDKEDRTNIDNSLQELVDELGSFGIASSYHVREGTASKEVLELCDDIGGSMIIVPKVSGSVVKNILIGSTAQAIFMNAEVSVLMVPADLDR